VFVAFQLRQVILCKSCIVYPICSDTNTNFAFRWCLWFSENDSSTEQVCPPLEYRLC